MWLDSVALHCCSKCPSHLQIRNMITYILHTLSPVVVVGLLWQNTSDNIQVVELPNFRILRDTGSVPWVNVLEKTLFWMQCSKSHINYVQRISTWAGAALTWVCRIMYTVCFYLCHSQRGLNINTGRSYQLYIILWMATSITTNFVWHSLHRWLLTCGSI